MKKIFTLGLLSLTIFMLGCVDDPQLETKFLIGNWEVVHPKADSSSSVYVQYIHIMSDNTLEKAFFMRDLITNEELYLSIEAGDFIDQGDVLDVRNLITFNYQPLKDDHQFAPKEMLVRDGPKSTRKISYKLMDNNTVLSIYQGCPADVCFDLLYDKQ